LLAAARGELAAEADTEVHGTAQQVRDQMDDLCSSLPGTGGDGIEDGTAQQVIAQLGVLCTRLNSPPEQWSGHPVADAAAAYQQHIAEAKREAAVPRYPLRVKEYRTAVRVQAVARMWLAQQQRRRRLKEREAIQKAIQEFLVGVIQASHMRLLAASQEM